jgi:energy-coupling factor transporter ATP-binding protein EcfA2
MKILIMGLSGAGKSELAKELHSLFQESEMSSTRINGDEVRESCKDWDFSSEGRIRQAQRMAKLAKKSEAQFVIADFIAPTKETRDIFNADMLIWLDTIRSSKYTNTDAVFQNPTNYKFKITKKNAKIEALKIFNYLKGTKNEKSIN